VSAGLSLEQAPPLSVPLRFFLSAPLFGLAAAGLLLWLGPDALASRWSAGALALTHLLVLGVLTMVMCGALLQMMPVLVGVRVARPRLLGTLCHGLLLLGTLSLASGFLGAGREAFRAAVALLGLGLGGFLAAMGLGLARVAQMQDNVRGMRWALLGLALTLGLGLLLGLGHSDLGLPLWRLSLTDLHLAWGLLGWIAALVAVVAGQVVPMFQMTPPYPPLLRRWLAPGLFALLGWHSLAAGYGLPLAPLPVLLLAALWATFALLTLRLLARRRRKVGDASLDFWRLGMLALLLAALIGAAALLAAPAAAATLGLAAALLFLLGFALSVVNGMLYKIVPFLVWLHLQQRLATRIEVRHRIVLPNMKSLLPEPRTRRQFHLHLAALVMLLAAVPLPALLRPAAALWLADFALLGLNLLGAARRYRAECRRIDRHPDAVSGSPASA
jgi:hypothetical protein